MDTKLLELKKLCNHLMIPDEEWGEVCLWCSYSPYMDNRPLPPTYRELQSVSRFRIERTKKHTARSKRYD